jgi:salicylate hydroxylase
MVRVVIVGAGVSGCVVARGLRRVPGVEVTLVEQVSRQDHANAGNGLNIGPNALKALDLVLPEMAAELRAASLPWTRWRAALVSGEPLSEVPLADVADRPGIRIRWSDLYGIARSAVADITRFGEALDTISGDGDDRLAIALKHRDTDERRAEKGIDLLVAGDGRYSRVRELCGGVPEARQLEVANFRLLIEDKHFAGLPGWREWDMEQWFNGPNRLLAYSLPRGSIYLSGTVPTAVGAELQSGDSRAAAALERAYLPAHGRTLEVCKLLVQATREQLHTMHWSRMQEIPMLLRQRGGRVLLVGDSAHAMVPTLGQGATQAIEDGCAFVALFAARAAQGPIDVPRLTEEFAARRRERMEFVRRISWAASAPLLAGADPVATHRAMATPEYRADLRRLYLDPLQLTP